MLDHLEDGVYITDASRRIRYWSKGAERISGYSSAMALGRRCADRLLRHVGQNGECLCTSGCPLAAVMSDGKVRSADVFMHHKDGHRVPVHVTGVAIRDWQGRIIGAFETFSNATERMLAIERVHLLEQQVVLDPLTGLANRRGFENELAKRLDELGRAGRAFGVVLCDIDHFKRFNDTYGHETGDAVLKMVAATLRHASRTYDTVARWGGEEFIVLTNHYEPEQVCALAERLRMVVEHSWIEHSGHSLRVTVSLGATTAHAGDDARQLFARADELLYRSKAGGRNRFTLRVRAAGSGSRSVDAGNSGDRAGACARQVTLTNTQNVSPSPKHGRCGFRARSFRIFANRARARPIPRRHLAARPLPLHAESEAHYTMEGPVPVPGLSKKGALRGQTRVKG
ncbi:MAG: sensor domain-containing diguanylate cyclase [Planctomycetes bacterium]|nr:sensor domain-containing diguanylate cyclase [Planctomycetota bacterium]